MLFTIISIIILVVSIILHEVAHGYMADWLGDPTARLAGRLSLNPVKHIDPVGSILVPILTSFAGFTFGWAKPVPYNPYNITHNRRRGELLIALAGPATNLLIALIFGTLIRIGLPYEIFGYIVIINIVLAIFNLIPLPPLDGSKILYFFLPTQYGRVRGELERFAPVFIFIVVVFVWKLVQPIVPGLFKLFTGL
ncbi:MAG TPA: site-2 protease family protein [Candidatus Paceibacterota bacterium]